jgi:hypothetical protein
MEFDAQIKGNSYQFFFINSTTVLISGSDGEYILYKNKLWHCADEIPEHLMRDFSITLDRHLSTQTLSRS